MLPGNEIEVHFHRGDLVFMGRLDDRATRVIVASHAGIEQFKGHDLTLEDFQKGIDRCGIRVRVLGADWMTPFSVNDRQAKHYRVGQVFLAGDASHIHSPVGGQGMNTGIQDVANLIWKLAAIGRGADPKLLDSYEEERGEVGKALLRFTERMLKVGTSPDRWVESLRDMLMPLITQLHVVQKEVAGFVSQTAIQYRESPVVFRSRRRRSATGRRPHAGSDGATPWAGAPASRGLDRSAALGRARERLRSRVGHAEADVASHLRRPGGQRRSSFTG